MNETKGRGTKTLTGDGNNSETIGKGAPRKAGLPDPRVLAFVRLLARHAAEQDYAKLLESHGKAQDTLEKGIDP